MGDFLEPVQFSDVIKGGDIGRKSSVSAEYLSFHDGSKRKVVKQISEHFPSVGILVLSRALVKEPIILCYWSALMVASEDSQSLFVSHLEAEQQADSFDGVVATVHIVS